MAVDDLVSTELLIAKGDVIICSDKLVYSPENTFVSRESVATGMLLILKNMSFVDVTELVSCEVSDVTGVSLIVTSTVSKADVVKFTGELLIEAGGCLTGTDSPDSCEVAVVTGV